MTILSSEAIIGAHAAAGTFSDSPQVALSSDFGAVQSNFGLAAQELNTSSLDM